jgi:hypothetical protein
VASALGCFARCLAQTRQRHLRHTSNSSGKIRKTRARGSGGFQDAEVLLEGRESTLKEGDVTLLDDAAPYRIAFHEPNDTIWLAVSPWTLRTCSETPVRVRVVGEEPIELAGTAGWLGHGAAGLRDIGLLEAVEKLAAAAGVVAEPRKVQQDADTECCT